MEKIVFFRVAWMSNYGGLEESIKDSDVSWIKDNGYCHEMFNFRPQGRSFYGFVEPKGRINIQRLDKSIKQSDDLVNNVTVIWVAAAPGGGTYVVGWYGDATIYRSEQKPTSNSGRDYEGNDIYYNVKANLKDCVLLPIEKRTFKIPTGKGGIGQSNIWYADDINNPDHKKYKDDIRKFILDFYKDPENSFRCECKAIIPTTIFTRGLEGKCSKCGVKISIPYDDEGGETIIDKSTGGGDEIDPIEPKPPPTERKSPGVVFQKSIDAVVGIKHQRGSGSGIIVNNNGLIVTNRHVVDKEPFIDVKLNNNKIYQGKVIKYFRDIDLAFLKIDCATPNYLPVNSESVIEIGLEVNAIGNPLGHEKVLTSGIVNQVNQVIDETPYILHQAAIEPGNSGGPLINCYVQLIGINTLKKSQTQMSFAIPVANVEQRLASLEEKLEYLHRSHFCTICGNSSFNTDHCDHCGVKISNPNADTSKAKIYKYTKTCSSCEKTFDNEASFCPYCGSN